MQVGIPFQTSCWPDAHKPPGFHPNTVRAAEIFINMLASYFSDASFLLPPLEGPSGEDGRVDSGRRRSVRMAASRLDVLTGQQIEVLAPEAVSRACARGKKACHGLPWTGCERIGRCPADGLSRAMDFRRRKQPFTLSGDAAVDGIQSNRTCRCRLSPEAGKLRSIA